MARTSLEGAYASRANPDGTKTYYKNRAEYEQGKLSSFGNTAQRLRRANAL